MKGARGLGIWGAETCRVSGFGVRILGGSGFGFLGWGFGELGSHGRVAKGQTNRFTFGAFGASRCTLKPKLSDTRVYEPQIRGGGCTVYTPEE